MKKNILIIIPLVIFILFAFVGCSVFKKSEVKNPSVKEISVKIKQTVDISDMKEGDSKKLKKLYNINSDDVEEFALYTAPSNLRADEIAIIKVKDSNNVNKFKDQISKRIEKQGTSFKDYLPDEYFLIEKHVLKTKGNYILLVISKDAKKIEDIFDGFWK